MINGVLIDCYRIKNSLVLWVQNSEGNKRILIDYISKIYLDYNRIALKILFNHGVNYEIVKKRTYLGELKKVIQVSIEDLCQYENIVKTIERESKHRLVLYNADIAPEQMFLFENKLKPFCQVMIDEGRIIKTADEAGINLKKCLVRVYTKGDQRKSYDATINKILIDDKEFVGEERTILRKFSNYLRRVDPDVLSVHDAFSIVPFLAYKLSQHNVFCPLHRWDANPINKKGGKTFYSYGKTMYREYATRLNGRFLVDSNTVIGEECEVDGIIELSNLSGTRFQQVASRSFGAVFQSALLSKLVELDYLIPFKEKPVDKPITLFHQLKFDRVGHRFDPVVGFHKDVAEIDFSSLFPWIIYNYNLSTETILKGKPPYYEVPDLPIKISFRNKGIIPQAIKPLLDRRMEYKRNPNQFNKKRTVGLKWVLVTSYGYLRFREFKLGIASSHMAIGAFARDIIIKAKEYCESKGFRVIHGIVDSLYIQKEGITKEEVEEVCDGLHLLFGIPLSVEGIFKWIVFLPSVADNNRPVPACYYGVFTHGEIKARSLALRRPSSPRIVREFQKSVLSLMNTLDSEQEIIACFPRYCRLLRSYVNSLSNASVSELSSYVRVSKTEYKHNVPQKIAIKELKDKGCSIVAGMKVYYVLSKNGVQLPEDYDGVPNVDRYKELFISALFMVLQPFGFTKRMIKEKSEKVIQSKINDYTLQEMIDLIH